MSETEKKAQQPVEEVKKTRKAKAKVPSVVHRSTRRAKRKDSQQECTLPQVIPRNQFTEMTTKQCFESEITRLVLQLPLSSFVGDKFQQTLTTRVENIPVEVRILRQNDNISWSLKLPEDIIIDEGTEVAIVIHGKYSWLSDNSIINKHVKSIRKLVNKEKWEELSWQKLVPVHSDMFISLSLKKEEEISEDYLGLINQGNTCYMNSYLQMLFHLPEFRRLIFAADAKEPDKFPATLQMLFYKMLQQEKSVSPEELIKSFGWSKKEAQVQQDVQQFSCLFFDILERKVEVTNPPRHFASIAELFCGELTHYIQCCHADFRTQNYERFYDLHIPLAPTISQSLDDYVSQQVLQGDNRYLTEYYGLQQARKGLKISKLPPVLMLQLKRFQYNYYTDSNQKILEECKYPENMQFSKWTLDPETPAPYLLYAVLVHQGSLASSGHYYVFIKIQGRWIKFNDERVEKATKEKALHSNYGGNFESVEYNAKEMKVVFKSVQNKATAYMLVYVNKQLYPMLFEELKPQFPQWLIQQTKYRQQMEQERKVRKQSICDIPVLRWSKHFQGEIISGMGFLPHEAIESSEQKISLIPKNQRIGEWLQFQKRQEENQTYILWTANDRQALINLNSKSHLFVKQVFGEFHDPIIIYASVAAARDQFLAVIKLYNKATSELSYHGLTALKKDSTMGQLHKIISSMFPGEIHNCYYIEDKKLGVIPVKETDDTLLPIPSPARNQLLIVVVEPLEEGEPGGNILKIFKEEMDNIKLTLKNEDNKEYDWTRQLNKFTTIQQVRKIIYEEIAGENGDCPSPQNIVVKYRAKKNSKILTEAKDSDQLSDIIKGQRQHVLHFSFSSLSINERLTQKQITFYYRQPVSKKLSEPQTVIVDKNSQNSVIDLICSCKAVHTELPALKNFAYRLFLLSKDKNYINDVVDEKGYVPGKGELLTVLDRQKYSALILEQYELPEGEPQELVNVLIHHVTKTGEKIGVPRWEYTKGGIMLSALKYTILDIISGDQLQFEGKVYTINPMKTRVLAFTKQWSRAQELPQPKDIHDDGNDVEVEETVESRFGKPRYLRVGIVHNQIAKSIQALKLNVE